MILAGDIGATRTRLAAFQSEGSRLDFAGTQSLTGNGTVVFGNVRFNALRVVNPVTDEDTLRTTLIPSLLRAAALNRNHGRPEVALFEVGRAYLRSREETNGRQPQRQPEEPSRLARKASQPEEIAGGEEA